MKLSIINYQLSTINYQLSTINYPTSLNYQLSTIIICIYPYFFTTFAAGKTVHSMPWAEVREKKDTRVSKNLPKETFEKSETCHKN